MNTLVSQLESLLLVAGKPMSFAVLAKLLNCSVPDLKGALKTLEDRYNAKDSGIHLMLNDDKVQLTTNPDNKKLIADFVKDETTGELTKPSLETLTIIAYRQPISKEELEQIRGVNCSLILRNLLIRGLIEAHESRGGLATLYAVSMDFLRYLGINKVEELPDFDKLHSHESIQQLLAHTEITEPAAGTMAV
jgi:segregation and condensation protein B